MAQATSASATAVPCEARIADGAIRGGLVGLLWAGYFGASELPPLRTGIGSTTALLRYGALSTLSFSSFFGIYSGLLCAAEQTFGGESLVCPLVAGGSIGTAIGAYLPAPRALNMVTCGGCTAAVSVGFSMLLSRK